MGASTTARVLMAFALLLSTSSNDGCYRPLAPVIPDQAFSHTYLTWSRADTATTMGVRVLRSDTPSVVRIRFWEQGSTASPRDTLASLVPIPGVTGASVAQAELVDLLPNTPYGFEIRVDDQTITTHTFHTLPDDDSPIRLVNGGDQGFGPEFQQLCELAAQFDPHAAIIGGDVAYADGKSRNYDRWVEWLRIWEETMLTSAGDLIPMIVAIGNHETNGLPREFPELRAPFFMPLFGQAKYQTNFLRTLGSHSTLVVLDTDHIATHESQVPWLEYTLRSNPATNLLAAYHVPLYPGHRSFFENRAMAGRTHWQPIFDAHGVDLAMEHHDHVLKRTYPLLAGEQVTPAGTVYIGDGAWGRLPREAQEQRTYLEFASGTLHFWVVDVSPTGIEASAIDLNGDTVDSLSLSAD